MNEKEKQQNGIHLFFAGLSICTTIILCVLTFGRRPMQEVDGNLRNMSSQESSAAQSSEPQVSAETSMIGSSEPSPEIPEGYIMKEHNGMLAVFYSSGELYEEFPVLVQQLPEYDRNLLVEGILVSSRRELQSLIEDYTS